MIGNNGSVHRGTASSFPKRHALLQNQRVQKIACHIGQVNTRMQLWQQGQAAPGWPALLFLSLDY